MSLDISTVGVRRDASGGSGTARRPIRVVTNNFAISLNKADVFYHYDVEIDPPQMSRRNFQIIERIQLKYPDIFNPRGAFDGKKNLYMSIDIGNAHELLDVFGSPDKPSRSPINVRLMRVNRVNCSVLDSYLSGQTNITADGLTYLTALNIVTKMGPIMQFGKAGDGSATNNARNIYVKRSKVDIGGGLEAWRGYRPSVRPGFGRLYLNLGVTVGVVYQPGDLISLCLQWLKANKNSPRMDASTIATLDDLTFSQLSKFLKNIRVFTTHRKSSSKPILRLIRQNANAYEFQKDGESITIAQYFSTTYGKNLRYPHLPCVEFPREVVLPMELLEVESGQLLHKSKGVKPDQTSRMMEFAKQHPDTRLSAIKSGFADLMFGDNDYTRNSGIMIDPKINTTNAHVLDPPRLQYGNSQLDPADGKWNITRHKLYGAKTIKAWGAANFDDRTSLQDVQAFMKTLARDMVILGMSVPGGEIPVTVISGQGNIGRDLLTFAQQISASQRLSEPPDIIVCVLPERAEAVRNDIKRFGDIMHGIATQIVVGKKMLNNLRKDRPSNQYNNNVALKINSKLGGSNWLAHADSVPLIKSAMTLILGADVTHPPPGSPGPSVAAVVCSMDLPCTQYTAECRVQDAREETITDLAQLVETLIYRAPKAWGPRVKQILFYRDGISEGQFDAVMKYERDAIKSALVKIYGPNCPKLTYIVVGKRHQMRMFPERGGGDSTGNCRSGTVVDTDVCNPYMQDYYLLSHAGLLGTSRPSHYSVLYDENGLTADQFQSTSYALCHIYARATRSVSIPAPVYYADKVASRFAFHFASQAALEVDSNMSDDQRTLWFKDRFKGVHARNQGRMYWM